ncbi:hypothetical protein ACH4ZX_29580 [Streptomyces sp. NPDC020490]|uniref:hypothetical protein n=1 Tax=Streptomyces sp. NPDC020490 TaxID=3365078 RepID=UPI0037AAB13E
MAATDAASAVRTASAPDVPSRRARWPLFGVAAGLLGTVATLVTDVHPEERPGGFTSTVISDVSRTKAHAGIVAGFLVVALLLVLAGAWRRRVEPQVPGSTAAHVVSGALAVYLPGGMDAGAFDRAGLYVLFMLNDFGSFIGWLGVVVAAGAIAWMALRERTVSRWIGAVSVLPVLVVTGFVSATGLPGFQGIVGPLWLVVAFLGLSFGRSPIVR